MGTSCVLHRNGTVAECLMPPKSTRACRSISSCALVRQLIDSANSPTDKADSNAACRLTPVRLNSHYDYDEQAVRSGSARPAPISSMTLKAPTRSTGSEETESNGTT